MGTTCSASFIARSGSAILAGDVTDFTGLLPAILFVATLALFYLVWGAFHDLAHGDEGNAEWTCLAFSLPAFFLLDWLAVHFLPANAKLAWLTANGFVLVLFSAGAVAGIVHPHYARGPLLGTVYLSVGLPVLSFLGYQWVREVLHKRASA